MEILKAYRDFMKDNNRLILLMGGAGSGKSWTSAQRLLLKIINEGAGNKILVVRKIQRTLKNSVYDLFIHLIETENLKSEFTCFTSPMEITYNFNGNKIVFLGLDDVEKLKSFQNIQHIWVEEATEINEKDFRQLNLRMRGISAYPKTFTMTFNPVDINGWLFKKFFSSEKVYEASIYKTTYLDNTFLDVDYIKTLEDLKNASDMDWKVYGLSEWGAITQNQVFRNWDVYSEDRYPDINMTIKKYEKLFAGVDFGSTHASVCLLIALAGNNILVLDEVYIKGSASTNIDFFRKVIDRNYPKNVIYYADSAEPRSINEMRRLGLTVLAVKKGKDSVKHALDFLKRYHIIIHPRCENLIKEITSYQYLYDEKTDTIFKDPDPHQPDDTIASLRYCVDRMWRLPNKIKAVPSLY